MNGGLKLNNTATVLLIPLSHGLLHHIQTEDNHTVFVAQNFDYRTTFALVLSGDNLNRVVFSDFEFLIHHSFSSQNLWGQGHDFHIVHIAKLTGYRTKDTLSFGVFIRIDNHAGVIIKTDICSVRTAVFF